MSDAKILIVDDVEENVVLIKAFLEEEGYQVLTADNGIDALEMIESSSPDLVLLDVLMPGLDGFEVCQQIKFNLKMEELPVVMVTALNAREDRLKGLEVGADDFISKPIDWAELIGRVRSLLRLRNAYTSLHEQMAKLDYQLDLARTVQEALTMTELPEALTGEVYYQATDKIGGDILDIVEINDDKYGLFLADSSGHGVPAALLMVMVKQIFSNIIMNKRTSSPAEVLSKINNHLIKQFADNINDLYVTALFMIIDLNKREISWCNAGHTFPILIDVNRKWQELKDSGLPIGIMKDTDYNLNKIKYFPDSKLFTYTDGLADLLDKGEYIINEEIIEGILAELLEKDRNGRSYFFNRIIANGVETDDDICYTLLEL